MRLVLPLIMLGCGFFSAQEQATAPLDRTIDRNFEVLLPVHDCTVPDAVTGLARMFHVAVGVEFLPVDCSRQVRPADNRTTINLLGLSIGDALSKLAALDPRYRWVESRGVILMRPVEAWADPKNMLNLKSESFTLRQANLGGALDAIISAITGEKRGGGELFATRTEQGARLFDVTTGPVSAGEALDAIARAHGDLWWQMKEMQGQRNIWFYTFDGAGLGMSPVPGRLQH